MSTVVAIEKKDNAEPFGSILMLNRIFYVKQYMVSMLKEETLFTKNVYD